MFRELIDRLRGKTNWKNAAIEFQRMIFDHDKKEQIIRSFYETSHGSWDREFLKNFAQELIDEHRKFKDEELLWEAQQDRMRDDEMPMRAAGDSYGDYFKTG